ncbi:hypothetical protein INS49_015648 [Diaporthe citri]|uniref:uncharacterized protein n=1 Tax=Diaporthe citri TaxID=83186 RepID=UPI001C817BD5|nr:uncharacterized protein INS49_015648 [Diaporthe citri]KAG6356261.1 hypothetical protein INS49_015648 [Diaporthe citri]
MAVDGLENYALVELSALAVSNKASVQSLRSLSQNKLFQELLSSDAPPDLTLLDEPMEYIRNFTSDFQHHLIEHTDALSKSSAAAEILKKAFAGEKHFDFTPFLSQLAEDDLVAFANSKALRHLKTANLSGIGSFLEACPTAAAIVEHVKLDSLYLLTRPDRRTEDPSEMVEVLTNGSNQPLVSQRLVLGSAFSRSLRRTNETNWKAALPGTGYWKTFPVMQLLYHGPTEFKGIQGSRENGPWLSGFFLCDGLLTPVRFVTGLLNVVKGRSKEPRQAGNGNGQLDVPLNFACAPSTLKTFTFSIEVSPIPSEALFCARSEYYSYPKKRPTGSIRDIHPKGWTAVMVHTAAMDPQTLRQVPGSARFRVALVRSKARPVPLRRSTIDPGELEVVDLKGFLELAAPEHADDLEACLSGLTAWAQTDDDLVSKLTVDEVVTTLQAFVDGADQ